MTPFGLISGREVNAMLNSMLFHDSNDSETDATDFIERVEEARQLARVRV